MILTVKRLLAYTTLLIFGCGSLIEPIYAESYLVYEAFPPVIWLTGKPRHCAKRYKHKVVRKHTRKVRTCRRRCGRLQMSVTYVFPLVAPCARCAVPVVQGGCTGCGGMVPREPDYGLNYEVMVPRPSIIYADSDRYYNPDLATADDDVIFDPQLNIDR